MPLMPKKEVTLLIKSVSLMTIGTTTQNVMLQYFVQDLARNEEQERLTARMPPSVISTAGVSIRRSAPSLFVPLMRAKTSTTRRSAGDRAQIIGTKAHSLPGIQKTPEKSLTCTVVR